MDKKIIRAKIDLMLTNPFWGSLITRLELRDFDENTFATNGKYLYVPDAKYYKDWTFQELIGVLAHETFHCAAGHIFRKHNKDEMKWNVASDFATNTILKENRFSLPKGTLYDEQYIGMTAEKIYNLLPDPIKIEIPIDLIDPGKGQGPKKKRSKDGSGNNKKEISIEPIVDPKELEQEWKESVVFAARIAKGRGRLPNGLEEYISSELFSKVPWEQILYRYLQIAKGTTDFTAYPFDRRHIYREVYLPSMQGESIELVCGIDTSGSISKEDLERYFSELRGICLAFGGNYTIHLFECDAKVQQDNIITEDTDIPKIATGRGGTDFRPVFEKVEEYNLQSLPIVFFTDLDGEFPDDYLGDGVFWVVRESQLRYKSNDIVPFGKIIKIENE